MVYLSQKLNILVFCKIKSAGWGVTVQGEKARRIPQLLRAQAEEAELAPAAKLALKSY
jgi:hypothetical protein